MVQLELGCLVRATSFAGASARDFLPATLFHYCAQLPVFLLGLLFLFLPLLTCFPLSSWALTPLSFSVSASACSATLCCLPMCTSWEILSRVPLASTVPTLCVVNCFEWPVFSHLFPLQEGTYFLCSQYITGCLS